MPTRRRRESDACLLHAAFMSVPTARRLVPAQRPRPVPHASMFVLSRSRAIPRRPSGGRAAIRRR